MEKILFLSLSLLFISIIMIGCAPAPSLPQSEPESTAPSENIQNSQGGMGGSPTNGYSDFPYKLEFYGIPSSLAPLVDSNELDQWFASCKNSSGRTTEDCNILNFIQTFNIPKEDIIAINEELGYYKLFTDKELDALYSNSKKQLADTFMNPCAIRIEDEIYTPKWVANQTVDGLKAAGITESILEAKCSEWKDEFPESSEIYTKAKALLDRYHTENEFTES